MNNFNLLVVEDDQVLIENLYQPLGEIEGVSLDFATSEAEAAEKINCRTYDLAFVDIHLRDDRSDRGGVNIIKALHLLCEGTSIVVVSGTGDVDATVSAYREGIVDFLQKKNLTNGEAVVKQIYRDVREKRKHQNVSLLGFHPSLLSLLSEPSFLPIWEGNLCNALGTSIEILEAALNNSLKERLPILRRRGADSFTIIPGTRACVGYFWSKKLGSAIKVRLAFPDVKFPPDEDSDSLKQIYMKLYRNLSVWVWEVKEGFARSEFEASIWEKNPGQNDPKLRNLPQV